MRMTRQLEVPFSSPTAGGQAVLPEQPMPYLLQGIFLAVSAGPSIDNRFPQVQVTYGGVTTAMIIPPGAVIGVGSDTFVFYFNWLRGINAFTLDTGAGKITCSPLPEDLAFDSKFQVAVVLNNDWDAADVPTSVGFLIEDIDDYE